MKKEKVIDILTQLQQIGEPQPKLDEMIEALNIAIAVIQRFSICDDCEDAAIDVAANVESSEYLGGGEYIFDDLIDMFEAGANWQLNRGVTVQVEQNDPNFKVLIDKNVKEDLELTDDDKLLIQIRKVI